MNTPPTSLDATLQTPPIAKSPFGGRAHARAFVALPLVLEFATGLLVLGGQPTWSIVAAIAALILVGLSLAQPGATPAADTVVLVGRSPMASVIASTIEERSARYGSGSRSGSVTVLRTLNLVEAASMVRAARCDEVIIAATVSPLRPELIDARGRRPRIVDGAEAVERLLGRIPLELAAQDRWFARLGRVRPLDRGHAVAKRAIDLTVAIGLGVAILPVLPLLALAIRLDSRGPVFYSQQRVGLGGAVFRIHKFRTMRQDAERNGAVWAQERDPRVTRSGRLMRLTRIDELPQLWNVLKGEMTLVGPRPERPEFTAVLAREIPGYDKRQTVKPGLTGWAQTCYRYTSSVRDTKAKVEYDLYYVKHASLTFDLRILLRTVKVVIGLKGR